VKRLTPPIPAPGLGSPLTTSAPERACAGDIVTGAMRCRFSVQSAVVIKQPTMLKCNGCALGRYVRSRRLRARACARSCRAAPSAPRLPHWETGGLLSAGADDARAARRGAARHMRRLAQRCVRLHRRACAGWQRRARRRTARRRPRQVRRLARVGERPVGDSGRLLRGVWILGLRGLGLRA
jgi:hypothetical protein